MPGEIIVVDVNWGHNQHMYKFLEVHSVILLAIAKTSYPHDHLAPSRNLRMSWTYRPFINGQVPLCAWLV